MKFLIFVKITRQVVWDIKQTRRVSKKISKTVKMITVLELIFVFLVRLNKLSALKNKL